MNIFYTTLSYLEKIIYKPNHISIKDVKEEKQNQSYGGGTFSIYSKTIRFRVSKKTPKKIGQFVALWEKDENNKNRPFKYLNSTDLLIITTFKNDKDFGQFIFPKEILKTQNILKSDTTKGKMAIRVYPSWDNPISKKAIETQKWQLEYFIDMSEINKLPRNKILELCF